MANLNNEQTRAKIYQVITLLLVLGVGLYFYSNVKANLAKQNIASGFDFFSMEAGFEISESVIEYFSDDTYKKALIVGILNTLKVAFIGNLFAILIGVFVGSLCMSTNWLVKKISATYIEVIRNIPLLLQLFFWYALFSEVFPSVRNAYSPFKNVFLSNRGVVIPMFEPHSGFLWMGVGLILSVIVFLFYRRRCIKKKELTGQESPLILVGSLIFLGLPLIFWAIGGAPSEVSYPALRGFNFNGGYTLTPELVSLLLGLILYTGAFNAEVVRAGIESVNKGQWEAARALGLTTSKTMSLVILPQALRVIIPPITSQILNLTKNSSLAVAIAYPDFVAVANTTMNQTGQAIELVMLIMTVYLITSLSSSFFMNWFNKRTALVER